MTREHKLLGQAGQAGAEARDLVYTALGAVLITVCAWISIPIPPEVPFTLQTLGVFLLCGLFGGMRCAASVGIYLLLGAIGLPVFASFSGGLSRILGLTGGYMVGFLGSALFYALMIRLLGDRRLGRVLGMAGGLLICYAFGSVWFYAVYLSSSGSIGFLAVLSKCVIPFVIPDAVKIVLALFLTEKLRPLLKENKAAG